MIIINAKKLWNSGIWGRIALIFLIVVLVRLVLLLIAIFLG